MEFSTNEGDGGSFPTLHMAGELDWPAARELEAVLSGPEGTEDRFILDLADVTYIESASIGLLITIQEDLTRRGSTMAIVCHDNIRRIFVRAGLTGLFNLFDDQGQAVAFLRRVE